MKTIYLLLLLTLAFNQANSAPVITATNSGNWDNPSTWDLNRVPVDGDSIIIKAGKTVVVSTSHNFSGTITLKIYGTIDFQTNGSTLNFTALSIVWVYSNGSVDGNSNSQKMKIGNNQVFKGNDLPIVGPQMASGSTSNFVGFVENPLPVKFIGFSVTATTNNALIQWSTAEEVNAYSYEVERSFDGATWKVIAYVAAIGNSKAVNSYSFTDKNISTTAAYYRIKQIDADGKFLYTNIKALQTKTSKNEGINIIAFQDKVLVQFSQEIKGNVVVRFVSINGQVLDQQIINSPKGQIVLNARATLKENFILAISNGQSVNISRQIIL